MSPTADVNSTPFRVVHGYDISEVNAFLARLPPEPASSDGTAVTLESRVRAWTARTQEAAERAAEQVVTAARAEAEQVVTTAQDDVRRLLATARSEANRIVAAARSQARLEAQGAVIETMEPGLSPGRQFKSGSNFCD
jgi:regulator of protease activity HflC (stomatin/prohibitin superfamily)